MDEKRVILKPGKEKAVLKRHPWIFSGAIAQLPAFEGGDVLPVYSSAGNFLAKAYFHPKNSIAGRILTFDVAEEIEQALSKRIDRAIALRKKLFDPSETNCYRLINSEGDEIPGFIADLYDDVLVLQFNTAGMERLRPIMLQLLKEKLDLRAIYEKSSSSSRKHEGLADREETLFGSCPEKIVVRENGISFAVDLKGGQKTGFFLDQREMRHLIGLHARRKRVLNCFSYSGGFSLFALKAGAHEVVSIDCSEAACRLAKENTLINHLDLKRHQIVCGDVFEYLAKHPLDFDLVILDPPAFAKKREDVVAACTGYKRINRLAFERMPRGSLLLTCSCSYHIDAELFQNLIFQAALEAKRSVKIISRHIQANDHPISLFHPEGEYLKSLLVYIE